jgi:hypothetical protein
MERQSVVVTISLFFASNRRVDAQDDKKASRFVVTTSSAEAKMVNKVLYHLFHDVSYSGNILHNDLF